MHTLSTTRPLHPVQWVAAISVSLFALAGIGAIIGWIPTSKSAESTVVAAVAPPPVATQSAAIAPTARPQISVLEPATAPVPKVVVKPLTPIKQRVESEKVARTDSSIYQPAPPPPQKICNDCGRIESIQRIVNEGEASGVGAVAGGVVGGALANNVGRGNGKKVATLAGIIGGAMLGNHVEKSRKETVTYQTTVRFDDGTIRSFSNPNQQGFYEGERVRVVNDAIQPE